MNMNMSMNMNMNNEHEYEDEYEHEHEHEHEHECEYEYEYEYENEYIENRAGPQPEGTIPVTLDVSAMYSNVPWQEGMDAFEEALNRRDNQDVPTSFLMKLVWIVLTCNLFVFNAVMFLQLIGVAMGTKMAPTFACIFMGWLEKNMLAGWRSHGGLMPKLWRRYIDDIWFLWSGTEEKLVEFVNFLNTFHPTIKFKCKKG